MTRLQKFVSTLAIVAIVAVLPMAFWTSVLFGLALVVTFRLSIRINVRYGLRGFLAYYSILIVIAAIAGLVGLLGRQPNVPPGIMLLVP